MTFAVIPAGGQSTRMGRPKLALPLGGKSVLEHVIHALHEAGIEHILVIVGPHVPELVPFARAANASLLLLTQQTPDMRTTVEQGLRWLEEEFHPQDDDAWLLVPADHPTLDADVVRQLLALRAGQADHSILIPTFGGKRGHPTLIGWKHVAELGAFPANQGLNAYLRQHSDAVLEVPVTSAEVLCDLDTPQDYAHIQAVWNKRSATDGIRMKHG